MQQMHTIIETTYKTGWHKSGAFVLPNQVLGGNKVRYQDSGRAATIFSTQGTLEDWKKSVSLIVRGQSCFNFVSLLRFSRHIVV
jgi:uncharacterized protein (DUF927 family)